MCCAAAFEKREEEVSLLILYLKFVLFFRSVKRAVTVVVIIVAVGGFPVAVCNGWLAGAVRNQVRPRLLIALHKSSGSVLKPGHKQTLAVNGKKTISHGIPKLNHK